MKILLVGGGEYNLLEKEELTFGDVGVYVWNKGKSENGMFIHPPKKFYTYGYVAGVDGEDK